jgi:hypothetical protein
VARKGKILKVRLGYNANSSSLAAVVTMLLFGSGAAVAVLSIVAAALFGRRKRGPTGTTDAR